MTDTNVADATANADVHPSQIIHDTGTDPNAQGRGVHVPEADQPKTEKPLSTREAIAKAFDEAESASKGEAEPKPEPVKDGEVKDKTVAKEDTKPDDKPQRARADDGRFAKAEQIEDAKPQQVEQKGAPDEAATGQDGSERGRQSEGRQHYEPPARFLPKEKEAYGNVPNVVKAAIDRMTREHETEVQQYRQSHEEWSKLDKFQQMAKQHNTNVYDALERYTRLDGLLQSDPITAMREILATRGITPQQYAEHVLNNPDLHTAPRRVAPDPVVHQVTSEVVQLRQEIAAMKQEQAAMTFIEPFRASHPRFDELQNDIAFFLQSGKIPASLNPTERLEAAYDMAERINPRSMPAPEAIVSDTAAAIPDRSVDDAAAGRKSIRGAPTSGQTGEPKWVPKSNREALERAFAQAGIR